MRKLVSILLVSVLLFTASALSMPAMAAEVSKKTLAYWKFQDVEGYYKGDVDTDTLTFVDLSGNGNDLQVGVEGNGAELDTFSWDTGVDRTSLKASSNKTALKFDNSLKKATSVDPYDSSQTSYSGAFVSGKYLHTVDKAPLNAFNGSGGWSIEVIFKVSPEWSNAYNRYTGIFSRQGVVQASNEPPLSLAMSSSYSGTADLLGDNGLVGLQYLHVDSGGTKTNEELDANSVKAGEWCHYMVTNDGAWTEVWLNGAMMMSIKEDDSIFTVNESFGWEVGVGRKIPGSGDATMNETHPEGLIRRLFCGTISEIRFSRGVVRLEDSLIYTKESTPTTTTTSSSAVTTTSKVANTTTKAPGTTTKVPGTTTKAPGTTTKAPGTTTKADGTTTIADGTTTTTVGDGSTTIADGTTMTTVGDSTTTSNVDANASTGTTTIAGTDTPDSEPFNWLPIIIGAVVVVGIAVVVIVVLKRKR